MCFASFTLSLGSRCVTDLVPGEDEDLRTSRESATQSLLRGRARPLRALPQAQVPCRAQHDAVVWEATEDTAEPGSRPSAPSSSPLVLCSVQSSWALTTQTRQDLI